MKNEENDYNDHFKAGQLVGMLVLLTFIERNNGIPALAVDEIKSSTARKLEEYFDKPSEDIFLIIDGLVNEMKI